MERYICIHGHFYQPPRENPWLEAVELQDSAYPYHDWNDRITAESYAPNATARILDHDGRIAGIVSNYSKVSFNFGPTLMAWMKEKTPEIHDAIIQADKLSQQNFSGHGSALAQVYNHIIMPLANRRDKYTQVIWGIRDFEYRFGRKPEGMWLAETAADLETLDVLAEFGIRFTILSPYQASRVRKIGGRSWRDVNGGRIDPTRAYEVRLPSKRRISVFFYDGPVSQAVAFEHLLGNGERFARRLMDAFDDKRSWDQLVHIATDGESYGHHHRQGEMALAYALHFIQSNNLAKLTNYGQFLESHPPTHEVEIHDKSAWSCSHGVERWRSNCGCNSGLHSGWNQEWRAPLREALDWLRDELAPRYEAKAKLFLNEPWKARDNYIEIILDRSPESVDGFFAQNAARKLDDQEMITALRLLELQRHALLMFTSCGWFFDELSGIETVQVIQYAGRALQLAFDLFDEDLERGFLERLGKAQSNIPELGDGRAVYERFVKPAFVNREKLGAHYAVSSLFESYSDQTRVYSFTIDQEDRHVFTAGKARLAIGRIKVTFEVTRASDVLTYGVLHFGDHNLNGGVRIFQGQEAYDLLIKEMSDAFGRADFPEVIRLMDRFFGESYYSLKSLFRDEQRKILSQILSSTLADVESRYIQITEQYTPLMRFLGDLGAPLPRELQTAADFVLNAELRRQFESDHIDLERAQNLLNEGRSRKTALDSDTLGYAIKCNLERMIEQLAETPNDLSLLQRLEKFASLVQSLPFGVNLWKTQNTYYTMLKSVYPEFRERQNQGAENAQAWIEHFVSLGEQLGFRKEQLQA